MLKTTLLSCLLLISCWPLWGTALQSDQNQVARVMTDYLQNDNHHHLATLKGHVEIDQGTTHLQADQISIFRNNKNVTTKIVAVGEPARYSTLPDGKQTPLIAMADKITFYPPKHEILLEGHSSLNQEGNSIHGPFIRYNTLQQVLVSNNQGTKAQT